MTRDIGLYLHIPFCRAKCAYCDFPSFAGQDALMPAVIEKMCADLQTAGERLAGARVSTLYIGGGTPSTLPPALLEKLLGAAKKAFSFSKNAECSCEMNPGTVTEEFLQTAARFSVNRVSLGVQSASDALLKILGRIHTFSQAEEAVRMVRASGIENINLDMMLGLPFQTLDDVRDTLDKFLSLAPTHISCYGLIVEEGTAMHTRVQSGQWTLPDEDTERDMYELARQTLEKNGFEQYEISNFARPMYACRHNVDCWRRREYVGIGCAACGFLGNVRYKNPATIQGYLAGAPMEKTVLSNADARFESVMLGLRMMEGVKDADFQKMHGVTLAQAFGEKLKKPISQGLLTFENGTLALTRRGMDVQNAVLVDLL